MFRLLLVVLGVVVVGCAGLYFWTGRRRYLDWAWRAFVLALGSGVVFFVVLLAKRLI